MVTPHDEGEEPFWVDTGDYLGWVQVEYDPWIFILATNSWAYVPNLGETGGWFFMAK